MRIVCDLGCRNLGGPDTSVDYLITQFRPVVLFGFDPNDHETVYHHGPATCLISSKAAWTRDGTVTFAGVTYRAHVARDDDGYQVPCFDFSSWLRALPDCELIVKMNIEGAEYPLLEHLHAEGTDALIDLLLVQWHEGETANGWDGERPVLCCPVEEWHGAPA